MNPRSTPRVRARSTSPTKDEIPERQRKQERLYREGVSHLDVLPGARNEMLNRAVPYLLHCVCEKIVLRFHMRFFDEAGKPGGWRGTREEHQRSVEGLIAGCLNSYPGDLASAERTIYDALCDDRERAAFRICRDLARFDDTAHDNPPGIYPLAYGELAARLDCANACAEEILKDRFAKELGFHRIETRGTRRAKGQRGIANRWRWLLRVESADG